MTYASKITVNQDKNNGQENKPIVLEESVMSVSMEKSFFWLLIEASESVTIEDPSGTVRIIKPFTIKTDSMISKESVLALKNNRMLSDNSINALQNIRSQ